MFEAFIQLALSILKNIFLGTVWSAAFLSILFNTYIAEKILPAPAAPSARSPAALHKESPALPETIQTTDEAVKEAIEKIPAAPPVLTTPSPAVSEYSTGVIQDIPLPEEPLIPQAELNEAARKVVVNVFCLTKTVGILEPITGSGVVIDERGVILTNAHVAQYLLLKDYKIPGFLNCVIRGGSPAKPVYKAELLYMPSVWIEKNALNIKLDKPKGTGEDDYALLYIAAPTQPGAVLPESIPAIAFDETVSDAGLNSPVLIASYPAGFLGGLDVTKNLWITSSVARILRLYTFREMPPYTEDAFSVGGTVVAQEGASGGGVFSLKSGKLIGLLSTSLLEGTTDERDLRAVTLRHIDESIKRNTGENLREFLSGNLKQKGADFNSAIAPQLTQILTNVLEKK